MDRQSLAYSLIVLMAIVVAVFALRARHQSHQQRYARSTARERAAHEAVMSAKDDAAG